MSKMTTVSNNNTIISGNNLTIAENEQKVYEAGQKSMVDESKIIEATATGENILLLDDVSEIPHEVSVGVKSKNLFNPLTALDGYEFLANGSIQKNSEWFVTDYIPVEENTDYVISGKPEGVYLFYYDKNKELMAYGQNGGGGTFRPVANASYVRFNGKLTTKETFQLEEGTTATPYTPFVDVSGATVAVYGRNILDIDAGLNECLVKNNDGTYTMKKISTSNRMSGKIPFSTGSAIFCSCYCEILENTTIKQGVSVFLYDVDGGYVHSISLSDIAETYELPANVVFARIVLEVSETGSITFKNPQIVISRTPVTDYEPFGENTLPIDENGKAKTKSISPYMTFVPSVSGAQVTADYHKSWGMQTEYDRFWDKIQQRGKRIDYTYAFKYWESEYIRPKYKVCPTAGTSLSNTFSLCEKLKKIESAFFDFSNKNIATYNSGSAYYTFYGSSTLEEIEDIGIPAESYYTYTFANCNALKTIQKLRIAETTYFEEVFQRARLLENLIIEGTIGRNGFNVQWSTKLSRESITSIINALSTTTSGLTVTLSKTAVNNAFTTDEWNTLIATRNNWTISLV